MLGLAWCPTEDTFQLIIDDDFYVPVSSLIKRGLVSRIAKLYDSAGILQPVIITAKILMQNLWRDNLGWDEAVPLRVINDCKSLEWHSPAKQKTQPSTDFAMHHGCAIYVCYLDSKSHKQSRLVCSKSRVAPLKKLTLPKLELQAAL
uniref:Uncharacterized protein n=1 Tax=Anopheles dirus TaxID=7168 RepID=A0A182NMZ6_9DIPT